MFTHTPREARALFVDALRSGKFIQGAGLLCEINEQKETLGYCCLGVACEVYLEHETEHVHKFPLPVSPFLWGLTQRCLRYGGRAVQLPGEVRSWLNLRTDGGVFDDLTGIPAAACGERAGELYSSLIHLNDAALMSFWDIADVIEREPAGLVGSCDR